MKCLGSTISTRIALAMQVRNKVDKALIWVVCIRVTSNLPTVRFSNIPLKYINTRCSLVPHLCTIHMECLCLLATSSRASASCPKCNTIHINSPLSNSKSWLRAKCRVSPTECIRNPSHRSTLSLPSRSSTVFHLTERPWFSTKVALRRDLIPPVAMF